MTGTQEIPNIGIFQDIIDRIQMGILFIDQSHRVALINEQAARILQCPECASEAITCHQLFTGSDSPCDDCPIQEESPKPKSYTLKGKDGEKVLIKVIHRTWGNYMVLTINDVTREVTLLKKIDLNRKEAEAKNIIYERRLQKANDLTQSLQQLFDHFPEAFLVVEENYEVKQRNKTVDELLTPDPKEHCYELIGQDFPCEDCPAEHGFDKANGAQKGHDYNGKRYTEIIYSSPSGEGGLLVFSETTRQVQLLEQIKIQRTTQTGLVEVAAYMQKEPDIEKVLEFLFDRLLPLVGVDQTVIVVDDLRPGSIWLTMDRGIAEKKVADFTKSYLSREMQCNQNSEIPPDALPWEKALQVPLVGGHGRRVGLLALPGEFSSESREILSLYIEQLGSYIHNQLLMRQLEEKANTDPLTGLYNRGFLEQALQEEQEKLDKYSIDYSLVVADVNMLKKANDVYGHEAGDKLIKTVSELLKNAVRSTDLVARTGGDEFLILLSDSKDDDAQQFIKRLKSDIFNNVVMEVGDPKEEFPVMVSLGGAGTDKYPLEDLQKEADFKMYADKEEYYKTIKRYR